MFFAATLKISAHSRMPSSKAVVGFLTTFRSSCELLPVVLRAGVNAIRDYKDGHLVGLVQHCRKIAR